MFFVLRWMELLSFVEAGDAEGGLDLCMSNRVF